MSRGGIFDLAKRDAAFFVTQGGFEEDILFSTPDGSKSVSLTGYATKHHMSFDSDGLPINSKNAHISLPEAYLVENGFTVRNDKGEIALKNYRVAFPDSSGIVKTYYVRENQPDETLGIIAMILGDFET